MATCLVFTPDNPEVYTLNPTAWLILRLCDGRPKAAIAESYHAAVEPMLSREEAEHEVGLGLEFLMRQQIIEVVSIGSRNIKRPARRLHRDQKTRTGQPRHTRQAARHPPVPKG
jgi:coenzyme PQQ synthesis protein D (PqqD)